MNNDPSQKIIELVNRGFVLNQYLFESIDGLEIPKSKRILLAVACYDQVIEHQVATCCLLRSNINGSAFALVRSVFEGFVRGAWLENCASDGQIEAYEKDNLKLKFYELLEEVEKLPDFELGVLGQLKKSSWTAMNSYTHSGILQASRRFTKDSIEPVYNDEAIAEVIKLADSFAILAYQRMTALGGRLDLADRANQLLAAQVKQGK